MGLPTGSLVQIRKAEDREGRCTHGWKPKRDYADVGAKRKKCDFFQCRGASTLD
jgi:hypothetical protein